MSAMLNSSGALILLLSLNIFFFEKIMLQEYEICISYVLLIVQ
jgi:hypothetical protein